MAEKPDEMVGGPGKNAAMSQDSKKALEILTELRKEIETLLDAAKKKLVKLDDFEAVVAARSALSFVSDALARAEKSIEVTILQLPPKEDK